MALCSLLVSPVTGKSPFMEGARQARCYFRSCEGLNRARQRGFMVET